MNPETRPSRPSRGEKCDGGQRRLPAGTPLLFVAVYFATTIARGIGWVPAGWSLMPVVETAWLNFLVVVVLLLWMRIYGVPLDVIGLRRAGPPRSLLRWVAVVLVVDTFAVALTSPILNGAFGDDFPVGRLEDVPGNLPLLLVLLPMSWLIGGLGEEIFFRGFLTTAVAGALGSSRPAWVVAAVLQAAAFGLIHAYQGPAQAITIGIGGAVYGVVFLLAGRNLWPLIIAHALNDTLGFILLYSGVIQP